MKNKYIALFLALSSLSAVITPVRAAEKQGNMYERGSCFE
mgnify:CR=1 FL=1